MDRSAILRRRVFKIIDDRKNHCPSYSQKKIIRMLKRRLKNLSDYEGKEVWCENNVFFIDDANDPMGFKRYQPYGCEHKTAYILMEQIVFLSCSYNSLVYCF